MFLIHICFSIPTGVLREPNLAGEAGTKTRKHIFKYVSMTCDKFKEGEKVKRCYRELWDGRTSSIQVAKENCLEEITFKLGRMRASNSKNKGNPY